MLKISRGSQSKTQIIWGIQAPTIMLLHNLISKVRKDKVFSINEEKATMELSLTSDLKKKT